MTVAFQRMFGILGRWNNNQVTPSLSKPHELSYRSNSKLPFNSEKDESCIERLFFKPNDKNEWKLSIIFFLNGESRSFIPLIILWHRNPIES